MQMKRILLFTESLGSGGAERQLVNLAVLLKDKGYDVTVLTYHLNQFYEGYLLENNVNYFYKGNIRNKIFGLFHLYVFLKHHNPDVVISYLPAANMRMCILRFVLKFKLLVSERSYTKDWSLYTNLQYNLYKSADYIIPNSYSECENILNHHHNLLGKVRVIQNYIDSIKFSPLLDKTSSRKPARLLCVGRLIPSKNILTLLDALAILHQRDYDFVFKWVGKQSMPEFYNEVVDRISSLSLEHVVTLVNEVDHVETLYQEADYFCFPTLLEGFPNALCEAMSVGLPVATSNVCGLANIVEEGVNGYTFDPNSVADIVTALEKLLNMNYEEYEMMSFANTEKIKNECSKSAFVDKYISLLE